MSIYGHDYDDDGNVIDSPDAAGHDARAAFAALGGELTGRELLDELHAAAIRYVIFSSVEAADAVVLWIAATHGMQAWHCAPRLDITSPVKRCGKSRLLDIIEATCHEPLITANISAAALVRSLGDDPPTLLLDEADAVFGPKAADNHEDLRGIINAGHSRNRPYIRWSAATRATEHCPTFAMAALAGIGALPDTITDRAVIVAMRRRASGESIARYRDRRDGAPLKQLGEQIGTWVRAHLGELGEAEPVMPVEDRAADTWEPLFAIADLAGGDWPKRAATAALALTAGDEVDTSLGARLLADLRDVFGDADAMHGDAILAELCKISEAPWADYYGKPLNARGLAKLLKPYGVASVQVKVGGDGRKGYRREHLHDAWTRYLPSARGVSETSETPKPCRSEDRPGFGFRMENETETGRNALTSEVTEVSEVSDTPCGSGRETGPCTRCNQPCRRYGEHGKPLCDDCRAGAQ